MKQMISAIRPTTANARRLGLSGSYGFRIGRVPQPGEAPHHRHHHGRRNPRRGEDDERRWRDRGRDRNPTGDPVAEHRIRDVPSVELAERQQVQRRRKHPEPAGEHDRVHVQAVPLRDRTGHEVRRPLEQQRLTEVQDDAFSRRGNERRQGQPVEQAPGATRGGRRWARRCRYRTAPFWCETVPVSE